MDLKLILEIMTDDIKYNRIKFGKFTYYKDLILLYKTIKNALNNCEKWGE